MSKKAYVTTYLNVNETHAETGLITYTVAEERHLVRGVWLGHRGHGASREEELVARLDYTTNLHGKVANKKSLQEGREGPKRCA